MELREIEIFLALADELHFGRTAARLYLSQGRVSQTIRSLEIRLGGKLFDRTSRHVALTPLGEKLRADIRPGYEQLHRAFHDIRELSSGSPSGELALCAQSFVALGNAGTDLIRTFHDRYPGCRVVVSEAATMGGTLAALDRMRRGELALMAVWLPVSQPDLTLGPELAREPRILLVPSGHPLATRGSASLEDLADYRVMNDDAWGLPEARAGWCPRHTPAGRTIPRHRRAAVGVTEILEMVAQDEIVHPTAASLVERYRHPGVASVPLRGLPPMRSALVWVTAHETPAIRAFVECATAAQRSTS